MVDRPVSAAAREAAAAKVRARQQFTDNLPPPPFGTRLETNCLAGHVRFELANPGSNQLIGFA
jgi:hypothetical protein